MILTNEIERLEKTDWKEPQSQENAKHDIAALRRMRQLHPVLDYADELLEMVEFFVENFVCICGMDSGKYKLGCEDCAQYKKAEALIAKIEGKK